MFCPECKCEYREGFAFCKDCACELVDVLPETDSDSNKSSIRDHMINNINKLKFICSKTIRFLSQNKILISTILFNIIFLNLGVFSLFIIPFSLMIFDAPGSEKNVYLWMFFYSLLTFPIIIMFSFVLSMIFIIRKKLKKGLVISLLPFINIIFCIIAALGMLYIEYGSIIH